VPDFTEEHARMIARETVIETFLALGVDMKAPGEITKVQQDFAFMRSARTTTRFVRNSFYTALCTVMASAIGAAVWKIIIAAHAAAPR
jgi:hypothetical protein